MAMKGTKSGDMVAVHYTGTLDDGTVFDSSFDGEPLKFTLGKGEVIAGFEEAVLGMKPGEKKITKIPADKAYGPEHQELKMMVPEEEYPEGIEPEIGQMLQLQQPDGRVVIVRVTSIGDERICLDANHPLAGKNLTFEIELVTIDSARAETNA
jgi:peptidylprolyl isomerase